MEKDSELVLSLVVPVFNTDRELFEKHVRSLDNVRDNRIEVVFVDDGSEPAYGEWLKQRLKRCDFSYVLIVQKNGGQNAARTRGLAAAGGEWIMFLDSDDPVGDSVGELLDYLVTADADLVLVGFQRELPNGIVLGVESKGLGSRIDKEETLASCPTLCGFVAKKSLLLEPRCRLIVGPRIAEDVASSFRIISASEKISSHPFRYRYVMNPTGTINDPHEEWLLDPIEAFRPLVDSGGGSALEWNVVLHVRLYGCMRVLNAVGLNGRKYLDELCSYCDSAFPDWRESKYIGAWLQNADIRRRAKAKLILSGRWRSYLMFVQVEAMMARIKHALV